MKNSQKMCPSIDFEVDVGRIVGRSLKNLRKQSGLTQLELANKLGIGQASVSKIENRGDIQISSLQRYVAALGCDLKIDASFNNHSSARSSSQVHIAPQPVFPLLHETQDISRRDIVLSIRPYYTNKILEGSKTVELRRRFPSSVSKGTRVYIYATSPVRAIVGCADVTEVVNLPKKRIWSIYKEHTSITKSDFNTYFDGLDKGYALIFGTVTPLRRALDLEELRNRFGFSPPQSFLYAKPGLCSAVQDEISEISN